MIVPLHVPLKKISPACLRFHPRSRCLLSLSLAETLTSAAIFDFGKGSSDEQWGVINLRQSSKLFWKNSAWLKEGTELFGWHSLVVVVSSTPQGERNGRAQLVHRPRFSQTLKDLCLKLAHFVLTNRYVKCKELGGALFQQVVETTIGTSFSVMYSIIFMIWLETVMRGFDHVFSFTSGLLTTSGFLSTGRARWPKFAIIEIHAHLGLGMAQSVFDQSVFAYTIFIWILLYSISLMFADAIRFPVLTNPSLSPAGLEN